MIFELLAPLFTCKFPPRAETSRAGADVFHRPTRNNKRHAAVRIRSGRSPSARSQLKLSFRDVRGVDQDGACSRDAHGEPLPAPKLEVHLDGGPGGVVSRDSMFAISMLSSQSWLMALSEPDAVLKRVGNSRIRPTYSSSCGWRTRVRSQHPLMSVHVLACSYTCW